MERWAGKVAIVTGASSGIGKAIATSLAKAGMLVVGLARRVEQIRTHSANLQKRSLKGKLHAVKCDMRNEDDILNAFDWTAKNVGKVSILINSAGTAPQDSLFEGSTENWHNVFNTNVLGLCIATREAVKAMKGNKIEGHIVHINSLAGQFHLFAPTIGVYGASKHAVTNLTEILRQEMVAQKTNIRVTSISPGVVNTDLLKVGVVTEDIKKLMMMSPMLDAEDVADAVLYALSLPQKVQINELTIRPLNSLL